jgi:hypothetical protein
MSPTGIRIAVLGPGLGSPDSPGFKKRQQIRDRLEAEGHYPFFPEDPGLLQPENPIEPFLEQEWRLLSSPDVHLVIMLHTKESIGVVSEISYFMGIPEIKAKTAILTPIELYSPNESLPANTVRSYFVKLPYTDRHFDVCQLVEECIKWASDRQAGNWPGIVPFRF